MDSIPISFAHWEMKGLDDDIRAITGRHWVRPRQERRDYPPYVSTSRA